MRCLSCNYTLDKEENALVFEHGEHIDLCKSCLDTTDIQPYQGNLEQLINEKEYHDNCLQFEYREYIDDEVFYYITYDCSYIGTLHNINGVWCTSTINDWHLSIDDFKQIEQFLYSLL